MALKTRFTELVGVRHPVMQGGMMWVGRAEMAAAVSNAGGLGVITSLTPGSPDLLAAEIERCKRLTDKPFGVNLTILPSVNPPPYADYREVIIESGVRIVETAGHRPAEHVEHFKAHGLTVIHKCTSVRHAISAEKMGVDVISIDGFECAGHPGEDDIGGLVLIPAAVDQVSVPVIASGGIADGRGLAAALLLGAEGVNMGTRFCATVEAPIHEDVKRFLVANTERDTRVIFRAFRNSGRVARNSVSEEVVRLGEAAGAVFEDVRPLVSGERGRVALTEGNIDAGLIWASQAQGLISDIPTCEVLLERMVFDAKAALQRQMERFGSEKNRAA